MLLVKQSQVNLQQTYNKIFYLYPAYNDTFVFLGSLGIRKDCITHVDKNGKVLFQHIFEKPMDSLGMMNQRQCIMLQTRSKFYLNEQPSQLHSSCISILDLKTYKFTRTAFYFRNQQTDQSFIKCFADTKYLCILQQGRYNDNILKLSYYHYPLQQSSKPFNIYTSTDNQWTYQYCTKQANHHSMIVWYKSRQDLQWEFRTYDLRQNQGHINKDNDKDNNNGKFNVYVFKQQLGIEWHINNIQVGLITMWQMSLNKFMLITVTNKQQHNCISPQLGVIQNNYICDIQTKQIKQASFSLGQYHDLCVDHIYLGSTFLIRTFDFHQGQPLSTPVYYLSNQTQQILAQQTWKCSYLYKDQFTGQDSNALICNQYENGDVNWFICSKRVVAKPKEITMHWLLDLYDGWDEELLWNILQITDFTK